MPPFHRTNSRESNEDGESKEVCLRTRRYWLGGIFICPSCLGQGSSKPPEERLSAFGVVRQAISRLKNSFEVCCVCLALATSEPTEAEYDQGLRRKCPAGSPKPTSLAKQVEIDHLKRYLVEKDLMVHCRRSVRSSHGTQAASSEDLLVFHRTEKADANLLILLVSVYP